MKPYMEDPLKREREGVHLIISGTDTGHLCVLDMDKGDVHCVVKVRGRGGGEGERRGSERGGTYVVTCTCIQNKFLFTSFRVLPRPCERVHYFLNVFSSTSLYSRPIPTLLLLSFHILKETKSYLSQLVCQPSTMYMYSRKYTLYIYIHVHTCTCTR